LDGVNFEFATATRIVFGPGKLVEAGKIAGTLGRRALVVIGKSAAAVQRAEPLLRQLEEYATFSMAGEPTFEMVRAGTKRAGEEHCGLVISFGGGSVIDAGKAIAMLLTNGGDPLDYAEVIGAGKPVTRASAPFVAIPTTAGTGAEVTRNAVLGSPEHRVKVSLRSPFMLPSVALVDPELVCTTPATGLDSLTQLIEPFVSNKANPMTDALCREGMKRVARSLRRAIAGEGDAREDMAVAALFSGMALANAGLGAVHGFAGPIGGMYDAPHGALCAALLPRVFAVNKRRATSERFAKVERMVGDLGQLCGALAIPSLRTHGVRREDFSAIIEKAAASNSMKGNPVSLTTDELREILEHAF
jgi:alcohol dehydrogenase class IV